MMMRGAIGGVAAMRASPAAARWCSEGAYAADRECSLERLGDNGVVALRMNRPARKNAFGRTMLRELGECLSECEVSTRNRVLILSSTVPGVFSAGADLKERKEMSPEEASAFVTLLRSTFARLDNLRCPTISVIDGAALGGGLELALSTDMRVCTMGSKLGVPETGLAIIPGAGGTQRLPRVVGIPRAKELIFTADPVNGTRAEQIGLVNYVEESKEAAFEKALKLASRVALRGPIALENAKRACVDGMDVSRSEGMEIEKACYANILTTKDRVRGLEAFARKEVPVYEGN